MTLYRHCRSSNNCWCDYSCARRDYRPAATEEKQSGSQQYADHDHPHQRVETRTALLLDVYDLGWLLDLGWLDRRCPGLGVLLLEHLSLDLVAGDEVPLIDGVLLENPVVVRLLIHSST